MIWQVVDPACFVCPCKFLSCWLLLFYLEGRQLIYQKLSQTLEEVFNSLTAKYPEYQSCGSSLAAFIIEKGKSVLILRIGEWETYISDPLNKGTG